MQLPSPSLLLLLSSLTLAKPSPSTLYATHYNGHVYTLTLNENENNLSLASTANTCGSMPSWLTLDTASRTLYCTDETADEGSETALSIDDDNGALTETATAKDVGGGVNSVIYHGDAEKKFLAVAHYGGSALSTFTLPLQNNQQPLQTFPYKLAHPSPKPQQDASHPHQVLLDPTGSFILIPDLGADIIRVNAIDKASGKLRTCPEIPFKAGSGPRHGVFWTGEDEEDETMLYTVSELGGYFIGFSVDYDDGKDDGCPVFNETQSIIPYKDGKLPEGATPSGIKIEGGFIYVSIRSDQGFAPNDSMVTLIRAEDGTVAFRDLTSSYGKVPRTFVINKAGDLVAIGNQASSNVVIVSRDVESGKLGDKVASLQVGEPGKVGQAEGLSSVIWDE